MHKMFRLSDLWYKAKVSLGAKTDLHTNQKKVLM